MPVQNIIAFPSPHHTANNHSTALTMRGSFVVFLKSVEAKLGRRLEGDSDGDLAAEAYIAGCSPDLTAALLQQH